MAEIPVIELDQDDPLARGQAYGEAARERISHNLEVYRGVFMAVTGETWPDILGRGRGLRPLAQEYAPDLMTEIEGIASGADRSWEEIFLLNARSEIIFSTKALGLEEPDECTALLAMPETTYNHDVLLAQNWDWYEPLVDGQVILKIAPHDGIPGLITFTEAGQVGKMGMNDAGIGLTVNNLTASRPRMGVPWLLITRRILESGHLTEATGRVFAARRAHSINFLIGHGRDEDGLGVSMETAATEEHVMWPRDGFLVHTNHFIEPGKTFEDLKFKVDPYSSTLLRLERTRRLLNKKCGRLDEDAVKSILADHYDAPYSVCFHPQPNAKGPLPVQTCLSLVMNLNQKKIHYCSGQPCRGTWRQLAL